MAFFFCCKDANIMVNLSKSSFFSRAFSFLNNSYSLESKSLGLNPQRIQSILAWKNPNCLALLSSFCSVLVYCGSHLPGIMLLCAPFFKMLRDKHFILLSHKHVSCFIKAWAIFGLFSSVQYIQFYNKNTSLYLWEAFL